MFPLCIEGRIHLLESNFHHHMFNRNGFRQSHFHNVLQRKPPRLRSYKLGVSSECRQWASLRVSSNKIINKRQASALIQYKVCSFYFFFVNLTLCRVERTWSSWCSQLFLLWIANIFLFQEWSPQSGLFLFRWARLSQLKVLSSQIAILLSFFTYFLFFISKRFHQLIWVRCQRWTSAEMLTKDSFFSASYPSYASFVCLAPEWALPAMDDKKWE